MINIYTSHVSFITTSSKVKYTRRRQNAHEWDEDPVSQKESGTKEVELGCPLTEESSIYCGQLRFDPASKSEYANPRNQDI